YWYYTLPGAIRSISYQLFRLSVLGLAAWGLLRQIFYDCWMNSSAVYKIHRRYHACSSLGKRLTRKRWLFWSCVLVVFLAAFMTIICIGNWDYDVAVISGGIALAAEVFIIAYQFFSGVTSREITSLVEQIGAISRAEPLDELHQVSPRSAFYEPFHQLEQLEEAVQNSARKQIQAERLKVDLITNVSHDLKTPLTSMVGYVDLLKQEELSPEAKDYIDVISQKQELLKEMIQNLFELSKSTSGVEELHMETLDMRKLLEQILGDMENFIQESGMTIRTTFDDPPLLFSGDNEKMYRVVQNLLENALKYSLENTRIYVDVKREEERLLLQIKNIARYEMDFNAEEITGRFVRGDRSRTTEGHGLGLAIASSFTQNMGGILNVEVDGDLFKVMLEFPASADTE
ncbi:MAG: HAMP domain-containing histidine kinase, partial [Lachnospiraceae bacterium]|nr:HAMP domain-containing histidine kinase [Lachnospiraceae bacterium]